MNQPKHLIVATELPGNIETSYPSIYKAYQSTKINPNQIKMLCELKYIFKDTVLNNENRIFTFRYEEMPKKEQLTPEQKKEKQREYNKKYHEEHKEDMKAYHRKQVLCDCRGNYMIVNKAKHLNSQKHQKYIKNLSDHCSKVMMNHSESSDSTIGA